ncbi:hypothetical protein AAVH_06225 [Aphelenchoides avenae]|nr:hypothetical protein AAVH_06225 [Aphelenchus avenae]
MNIGRTGTFVAMEMLLHKLLVEKDGTIIAVDTVKFLAYYNSMIECKEAEMKKQQPQKEPRITSLPNSGSTSPTIYATVL